jgi:hypothetical protein
VKNYRLITKGLQIIKFNHLSIISHKIQKARAGRDSSPVSQTSFLNNIKALMNDDSIT